MYVLRSLWERVRKNSSKKQLTRSRCWVFTPQAASCTQMGLPQLLPPSKLGAAQASIQAGGDGVRDGVAMILTAIAEYNDMEGADGVNGSQVSYVCQPAGG